MNIFWIRLHTEMEAKPLLCLILLCGFSTIAASEVHYIVRPSQSQSCGDRFGNAAACVNNELTLSQFVSNSSHYLTNDTTLIFSPGKYSLESELIVENIHFFSMYAWSASSSKAVITCDHNARFEFRNISTVTVSGLEFLGCVENYVLSVDRFQLENSAFFGNARALVNGTVLSIEEGAAILDRVAFISVVNKPLTESVQRILAALSYPSNCTELDQIFSTVDRSRAIGISLTRSSISITQSWFEGNNVGLIGGVLYDELGSDITIVNTTFTNNSAASDLFAIILYTCYCYNDCSKDITSGIVYANGSTVEIYDSKFIHNVGVILFGRNGKNVLIAHTKFINNEYRTSEQEYSNSYYLATAIIYVTYTNLIISHSTFVNNTGAPGIIVLIQGLGFTLAESIIAASGSGVSISHSEFSFNKGGLYTHNGVITSINHSNFINNTGSLLLYASNMDMISVTHSEFVDNTVTSSMLYLDDVMITVTLSAFINNTADCVVDIQHTSAENVTIANNVFHDNSAEFYIHISLICRPDLSLSLGSSHCIQCSENWHRDLIGIVVAAFIAGIALIIFMLALNMTVAVGTLNGILFYVNIVAANTEAYFLPFTASNFITTLISWLNLDIGFDVCFFNSEGLTFSDVVMPVVYKALLQLAFPAYVIIIVIIVIVASECSSKFAKVVGKGNPIAVLATLILLSYAKFFNAIFASVSLLYRQPAQGSRNLDITKSRNVLTQAVEQSNESGFKAAAYFLIVFSILILILCIIFTALVFSWQWLLQYQDKAILKWVRYQKLRHFFEPYHAPYTAKYRYWTGLLLLVRVLLYLTSVLNFSLDPRVDLMAVIFAVGSLILLKGVTAKRVYKSWPLDVMETAIYFNLVAFSALTWYNLDFEGNPVAVAYTSVMVIFIFLLGVIVFHVLRYTRLYKLSFVKKAFRWTSSKLLEKKSKEPSPNDAPEELDGYRLERSPAGDQELPTVTYSVVEINQQAQNQEKNYTE